MGAPVKLFLASSNPGKLAEFRTLVEEGEFSGQFTVETLPAYGSVPEFLENYPTFAENAAGKALYYSQLQDGLIFADDSGLVVPALGGQPGVLSARYAGPNSTNAERIAKLLKAMEGKSGAERSAHFVCVIAIARQGRPLAVVSERVDGELVGAPRGTGGFGYDPVFSPPAYGKTFAELSAAEKNRFSHRGKAFRRLLACISSML
ncbi:MAG TPA: RdgB/HAM1 family non-canonical purine NTP pyrophosphatase [Candidatus Saccharimonadales bacterium]|nr:RdgB/HAM1 family non-canonical purine NTP pyrophosphatase [Candidatus Saccharimonadales bacterium]